MAYRQDLLGAAKRHLRAAEQLYNVSSAGSQPGCKVVAGYLFGIAGELAVKEMMRKSGMVPLDPISRRDDPYYAHFPALKTRLRDAVAGRRAGELKQIAEDDALFQNWDTDMRYAPTNDVDALWVEAWKASAQALIQKMEGP